MQSPGSTRRDFLIAVATATAAVGLSPLPLLARKANDERADFFDNGKVCTIVVELSDEDIASLRRESRKYVKATIKEDGKVCGEDVGVHIKGSAGSVRSIDDKPALTLSFAKFKKDQRYHAMAKVHLNNSVQDPSYTTDLLCGELFRAAGVPASRFTHALVSINDRKVGLYCVKEGFDKTFLKNNFGNSNGNFYDGGFLQDIDGQLQRFFGKGDVNDRSELKALFAAAHDEKLERRFEKLAKLLDLDRFVSFLALEVITWDWDGYAMKSNNYRVYHDPSRDKITFIPTGMDQMFDEPEGPLLPDFGGAVARAFVETPDGRKLYLARVEKILRDIFHPDALVKRLDDLQARLQPALASFDPDAGKNYPATVDRVREGVRIRRKSINEQLSKAKEGDAPSKAEQ
jgi:spore coat protein H